MSLVIDINSKPSVEVRQDALASLRSSSLERDDSGKFRIYTDDEGNSYYI